MNGATRDKKKKKKEKFWEPEGCRCSHWGDLTEVLLGSLTPEQADENRNPCLKNNGGKKKLQYGFKNTHKHTKRNMPPLRTPRPMILISAGDCRKFDVAYQHYTCCFFLFVVFLVLLSWEVEIFSHVWHQWGTFSFFLRSTHFLGPDLSPTPCLASYLRNFFKPILHNLLHWWNHLQLKKKKSVLYTTRKSAAQ